MSQIDPQEFQQSRQHVDVDPSESGSSSTDERSPEEQQKDKELAERLSPLIEDANSRVTPLTKMIRQVSIDSTPLHTSNIAQHIEAMFSRKDDERDEDELIKQVKPLLEQAEKILNETEGSIRGADPDKRLSKKATRHVQSHKATPEEQRLAEALKVVRPFGYTHLAASDRSLSAS